MTAAEIEAFMLANFPQIKRLLGEIEELQDGRLRMRVPIHERYLRPGGSVSGPFMMTLADTCMYILLLSMIGPVALAYTANLNIHFLKPPIAHEMVAEVQMLKLGKRLAVGDVLIRNAGDPEPAAQATVTYSIPPTRTESGK